MQYLWWHVTYLWRPLYSFNFLLHGNPFMLPTLLELIYLFFFIFSVFIIFLITCISFFLGFVSVSTGALEKKSDECPQSWSCRRLWVSWHRCWELNSGVLQEQYAFLTSEPFLQPSSSSLQSFFSTLIEMEQPIGSIRHRNLLDHISKIARTFGQNGHKKQIFHHSKYNKTLQNEYLSVFSCQLPIWLDFFK